MSTTRLTVLLTTDVQNCYQWTDKRRRRRHVSDDSSKVKLSHGSVLVDLQWSLAWMKIMLRFLSTKRPTVGPSSFLASNLSLSFNCLFTSIIVIVILYNCTELLFAYITWHGNCWFYRDVERKENIVPKKNETKKKTKEKVTEQNMKVALCMCRLVLLRYFATTCNCRVNY